MRATTNTLKKLGASALLTSSLVISAGAHAALDNWGTYASASTSTCASFSDTCSVGTGPAEFAFGPDNVMGSTSDAAISDVRGSAFASSTLEAVNSDLNTVVLRAQASGNANGISSGFAAGIDAYTYTGTDPITLVINATLTGSVNNPSNSAFNDISGYIALIPEFQLDGMGTIDLSGFFGEGIFPIDDASMFLNATGSDTAFVSIDLQQGDSFYLYSTLSLGGANGGNTESMNSLRYVFSTTDGLVSSSEAAVVPVPAAVWLMGSALLGLFGMRRKA
ncbi:MAG: hypothetical protein AB8G18_07585 [Gammaproteobacteria bacterium]